MVQVLVFLAILSTVVLIHELGHLLAAKIFGVRVDEFGFGLPPRLFRLFRKGETEYTINALPIGGFVRLYGENGEVEADIPDERAFWSKKIWQRAVVLVAGVAMNFVLGVVLFGTVYSFLGIPTKIGGVKITEVRPDSPAQAAGVMVGDVIGKLRVDSGELRVEETKKFLELVSENKGKEIVLLAKRGEETKEFKLVPRVSPPEGELKTRRVTASRETLKTLRGGA